MSGLNDYLADKCVAVRAQRQRVQSGEAKPRRLEADVRADDRSGVRRICIRDFQLIAGSGREMGGFDLGPPVELFLGAFGGCLAHTLLVQAAAKGISLDMVEVAVSATLDPRAGHPAHPEIPVHPRDIAYDVHIASPASSETIERLLAAAERVCPITSLLVEPQQMMGSLTHTRSESDIVMTNSTAREPATSITEALTT